MPRQTRNVAIPRSSERNVHRRSSLHHQANAKSSCHNCVAITAFSSRRTVPCRLPYAAGGRQSSVPLSAPALRKDSMSPERLRMLTQRMPYIRATSCTADSACSPLPSLRPRSSRSSASATPAGVAPAARMISTDSRMAVPAVITSSTMSTRPASGRPTMLPPSPCALASLRLNAKGRLAMVRIQRQLWQRRAECLVGRDRTACRIEPRARDAAA